LTRYSALLRRPVAVLLAAAVSPFIGVAAAQAGEITVVDSIGDVRRYDNQTGRPRLAPEVTNGDFTRVTYNHRLHRVVLKAEYVDLLEPQAPRRNDYSLLAFATRMRTNEGAYRVAYTIGDSDLPEGMSLVTKRRGATRCDGLSHRIDYEANTIKMSVPRSCLGGPRWVRFTSAHFAYDGRAETSDQPHDNGVVPTAWTSKVHRARG
jgi:hypothetical protein